MTVRSSGDAIGGGGGGGGGAAVDGGSWGDEVDVENVSAEKDRLAEEPKGAVAGLVSKTGRVGGCWRRYGFEESEQAVLERREVAAIWIR